jgi:3-hydroxyisobutyrate dehydrogenase-like beta-hydroxyacid dehydrogenase
MANIGILHPGEMGISVAASMRNSGNPVYWASQGRGAQTRTRAEKHGLKDAVTLSHLCEICSIIVSVCPPDAAEDVAKSVLSHNFTGLYVDMNAVSPQRVKHIGHIMADAGVTFVDGSIIGGPAWTPGTTRLYLSGEAAEQVAGCLSAGPLEAVVIGAEVGKASALKMCYAAYTKGMTALLAGVLATAESLNVLADLEGQWTKEGSELAQNATQRVRRVTAKAWRFAGEMDEIAATFDEAGTPEGFHRAAADIYRRLADFKNAPETPSLEAVLQALLHGEEEKGAQD